MDAPRTPAAPGRSAPSAPWPPAASSRERIREELGWRLCQPLRN